MLNEFGRRLCAAVLGAALVSGCAAGGEVGARPGSAFTEEEIAGCGCAVRMPGPVRARRVQDGAADARIAWGIDADGSRYEVACFALPERLDPEQQAQMLARVEVGLAGSPPPAEIKRRRVAVGGVKGVEIALPLRDDRVGRWWIFFDGKRMLQVSAVGEPGERLSGGTAAFFGSFHWIARERDADD